MTEVVVAIISGGSALLVSLISNAFQANATRKLLEYRMQIMEAKLDKQDQKLDKHNQVQDRVMILEYELNTIKEQMKGGTKP